MSVANKCGITEERLKDLNPMVLKMRHCKVSSHQMTTNMCTRANASYICKKCLDRGERGKPRYNCRICDIDYYKTCIRMWNDEYITPTPSKKMSKTKKSRKRRKTEDFGTFKEGLVMKCPDPEKIKLKYPVSTETSVLKRGRLTYWMSYEKTEVVKENDNRKENDKTKQEHYL